MLDKRGVMVGWTEPSTRLSALWERVICWGGRGAETRVPTPPGSLLIDRLAFHRQTLSEDEKVDIAS